MQDAYALHIAAQLRSLYRTVKYPVLYMHKNVHSPMVAPISGSNVSSVNLSSKLCLHGNRYKNWLTNLIASCLYKRISVFFIIFDGLIS